MPDKVWRLWDVAIIQSALCAPNVVAKSRALFSNVPELHGTKSVQRKIANQSSVTHATRQTAKRKPKEKKFDCLTFSPPFSVFFVSSLCRARYGSATLVAPSFVVSKWNLLLFFLFFFKKKVVRALGNAYHVECLSCTKCHSPIDGPFVTNSNKPYHKHCAPVAGPPPPGGAAVGPSKGPCKGSCGKDVFVGEVLEETVVFVFCFLFF